MQSGYKIFPVISASEDTHYTDHLTEGLYVASSYAGSVMSPYTKLSSIPVPYVPETMAERAADWGGYRIVKDWGGKAPFSVEQYITWLSAWGPTWAATWDYPCGDDLGRNDPDVVRARQDETTLMAWHFWHYYKSCSWTWVPTVQGWEIADYQRHAQDLLPLIVKMRDFYQQRDGDQHAFRVGIGSLVKRKPAAIKAIIDAVASILPDDVEFHAWGLSKKAITSGLGFQRVRSSDTSSFNGRFGSDLEQFKGGEPQRKVVFQTQLPKYQEAVYATVEQPKQYRTLFDCEDVC